MIEEKDKVKDGPAEQKGEGSSEEEEENTSSRRVKFICEHCNAPVNYEFLGPIAVRCDHCDSVFDARLQLVKRSRKAVDE